MTLTTGRPQRLGIRRHFTTPGVDPYDTVEWERRDARIANYRDGSVAFEQLGVEFPVGWSINASNIVTQKYFRGTLGTPERETSLRQVIDRIVDTYTAWGDEFGYFEDEEERETFRAEMKYLKLHQRVAFNSPVWFNIGVADTRAQVSACQPYDALVNTPDGFVSIGHLVETNAIGAKVLDHTGPTRVLAVKHNGRKEVFRVRTHSGHTLDVTSDHLVWKCTSRTASGRWVRAGDLKPGDALLWNRATMEGSLYNADPGEVAEAALAAWLQTDGFVGQYAGTNRSLTIEAMTVNDDEHAYVVDLMEAVFPGAHYKVTEVDTDNPNLRVRRVRMYGEILREFIDKWDLMRRGIEMSVPERLLTAPLPVVAAYLRSAFQAEGYVSVSKDRHTVHVGLAMISEGIVRGCQTLLARFGIFGRVSMARDARADRHDCYVLMVSVKGEQELFATEIGFVGSAKNRALEEGLDRVGRTANPTKALTIKTIRSLGETDVYDIQTESGEYLSGNLRVHNCFILSVEDTMRSILNWYVEEGIIFQGGSGAGVNLSAVRSSFENLRGGGLASGPVSFMRGADASAGTIKSGGKTRRAAKMVILNADHPDIETFIWCKAVEERKARVLRDNGFDMDLDGKDSHSTQYQNANNSVRVTDEFMQAVVEDRDWHLRAVKTGVPIRTIKARKLFRQMMEATWECADPGMQFDTTINRWHTLPEVGPINGSNPCSEYMSIDNSSCNLASLNLLKFLGDDNTFDVEGFRHAASITFTAMDISICRADFPTEKITENTRAYRQLGLGYANLGALLMALGLPYDSNEGRAVAATITALMCGEAYATSGRLAARVGPFKDWETHQASTVGVLRMHRDEMAKVNLDVLPARVRSSWQTTYDAALVAWNEAVSLAESTGIRNSQGTLLAPTGTIGLSMDCDTTGIEPDLGLIKTKKLVGGGAMSIVNQTVPRALRNLGYTDAQIEEIRAYIDEHKSILGAPHVKGEHLAVFACSMGDNPIEPMGHIRMMAAVQPFLSGAISKCVTGETLIATENGLVRIGALADPDAAADSFSPMTMKLASLEGDDKTDAFYYGGVRPVVEVGVRSGHRITGTPNHRLLVATSSGIDWKRLDQIAPGDHVAIRYGSETWAVVPPRFDAPDGNRLRRKAVILPSEMTEELAFLLGAYASEGCLDPHTWRVIITNSDAGVRARIAECFKKVFDLDTTVEDTNGARCPAVVATSKTVYDFFESLGCGRGASAKRIPAVVLQSPRPMVLAFLQGLALDAYATQHGNSPYWGICVASNLLLDDLQAVLTNLGIVHSRISKWNSERGCFYDEVFASGHWATRLCGLVPFPEEEKRRTAAQCRQVMQPGHDWSDVVPGVDRVSLHEAIPVDATDGTGLRLRDKYGTLRDPRTVNVSRNLLERMRGDGIPLPTEVDHALRNNLRFSPVTKVGPAGTAEVFDVSVPASHAFVGNGMANHNTCNVPETATVEDMEQLHIDAWRMGLKSVAVYRDNCKVAQPLSTARKAAAPDLQPVLVKQPVREKLPRTRNSKTFSFRVADCHGYCTVGQYDDGRPGEIFLKVAKQGSTLAGIMDAFAISVSHGLQYGVPLKAFVQIYTNMRFEPAGMTDDPDIRFASSLVDYIFRRLAVEYLPVEDRQDLGILTISERMQPTLPGVEEQATVTATGSDIVPDPVTPSAVISHSGGAVISPHSAASDAPICWSCGVYMVRAGSCYVCQGCGTTSGCS